FIAILALLAVTVKCSVKIKRKGAEVSFLHPKWSNFEINNISVDGRLLNETEYTLQSRQIRMRKELPHVNAILQHIEATKVDEREKTIDLSVSLTYSFIYPEIRWNPADYGNITETMEKTSDIGWFHKIKPCHKYDSFTSLHRTTFKQVNHSDYSHFTSDGRVTITTNISTTSSCPMQYIAKHWESHNCSLCLAIDDVEGFTMDAFQNISAVAPIGPLGIPEWAFAHLIITSVEDFQIVEDRAIRKKMVCINYSLIRHPDAMLNWTLVVIANVVGSIAVFIQACTRHSMAPTYIAATIIFISYYATEEHNYLSDNIRTTLRCTFAIMFGHSIFSRLLARYRRRHR
ncbi:hypothetical protein PENTCL1PPCAC_28517, partial [Pristionchus entomophagus]